MPAWRLLPLVAALGCSEYGFGTRPDAHGGGVDDPSDPVAPDPDGGDTGDESPSRAACEPSGQAAVDRLANVESVAGSSAMAYDFDAAGQMLAVHVEPAPKLHQIGRLDAFGDWEGLLPKQPQGGGDGHPRALADGRFATLHKEGASYGVRVHGAQGVERQIALDASPFGFAALSEGALLLFGKAGTQAEWVLEHVDLATGKTWRAASGSTHAQAGIRDYVYDVAISRDEGTVYAVADSGEAQHLLAFPRTLGGELEHAIVRVAPSDMPYTEYGWMKVAVDACDHVYLFTGETLWRVPSDADEPQLVAKLPTALVDPQLFWGHGAGYSDEQTLYVTGTDPNGALARYTVATGYDGTHVLRR